MNTANLLLSGDNYGSLIITSSRRELAGRRVVGQILLQYDANDRSPKAIALR